jgi:peptide/nickel transport system ATP-binding protein
MTLAIEDLSIRYRAPGGAVAALSDVSLGLAKGQVLAVVGESGSGKSSIALALMGLLPAEGEISSGRILFDGVDVLSLDSESRRRLRGARMALVFQDPFSVLNPSLRVGQQIGEGLIYHRGLRRAAALARAKALLGEVGIAETAAVANAFPHELSGGMRQRALIAGALACEPDLLILDEPTTALDVTIEAQILDLLQDLQARRALTILFITHNLGVVRRIAGQVAVLYAGQVVEHGATAEVFAAPMHPYTKGLLAAIPRLGSLDRRLASIPGRLPDLRQPAAGCRFQPRCPFAVAACAKPQVLAPSGAREVRCHRARELAHSPWPDACEDRAPRKGAVRSLPPLAPIVDADGLMKTFALLRGLTALSISGGRLSYRPVAVRAVDGVAVRVAAGEVLGLVGESGSGKSTLGRLILRLLEPDGGSLRVAGVDVTRTPQSALGGMRRTAQIVFQNADSALNPRKTVLEIIARPLRRFAVVPPGEIGARVRELLDLVRLPEHYAHRYPHQMSGGEKQRVGIARALASGPGFLVCDEPVSALDVSVQAAIVNLLAELRDDLGVAYLFISHDISVVAHLADRIAVMYRGKIVEEGRARDVTERPYHPYTEALLSAVPVLDGAARQRIRLAPPLRSNAAGRGCVFAGRCHRRVGEICDTATPPLRRPDATRAFACHHEVLSK